MPAMTYKMDMDPDGTLVPVQYEDDAGRVPDGLADMTTKVIQCHILNQDHGWLIDTVSDMTGYRKFDGWTDVEIARMCDMVIAMRFCAVGSPATTTTNEWLREYNLMP